MTQINYRKIEKGGDEQGNWDEVIDTIEATGLSFREGASIEMRFGLDMGYMIFEGSLDLDELEKLEAKLHEDDEGGCWRQMEVQEVWEPETNAHEIMLRWIGNY